MIQLAETEFRVFELLATAGERTVDAVAEALGMDQSRVHAACVALQQQGFLEIHEDGYEEFALLEGALAAQELPERTLVRSLNNLGGSAELTALPQHCRLDAQTIGQTLRWLRQKGWAEQAGRALQITAAGRSALEILGPDEQLLGALGRRSPARDAELRAEGIDLVAARELLSKRKGYIKIRERVERTARLSEVGLQRWGAGEMTFRRQVNLLTAEMLQDGSWREVDFRPYDVSLGTARVYPGKTHPFQRVLDKTRRVFLELGFTEIRSPLVESSFWDFDALFQPQDHPAREMQDTFYVARPERCSLPDPAYLERVARTHEDGGDTGSVGWRYSFARETSQRPVLRTHSTAATVRALAADPRAPRKAFCVGQVFRRETVDYKHLPVFRQVDGIVIDEHASFATLLGILDAFYRKMGFDRFEFRPAFFPYTEPSVEIFVWLESKQDWVEMGGAGVFRPEVTEPAGCPHPVLAWGLGLERLAMLSHGLQDIRELYISDLDWLKGAALCR